MNTKRMRRVIVILEDDSRRLEEMRRCVASHVPECAIECFDRAGAMIAWLEDHLAEVALISLDHDLPILKDGTDAGSGRMVAEWLAARPPACPVIVHTSNENFAPGMMRVLRDAGWTLCRVYPHDDCVWIAVDWVGALMRYQ